MTRRRIYDGLVVAALVVAAGGAMFGIYRLLFPPPGDYVVKAEYKDAAGLTKNSQVKIGGVPGGRVTGIALTKRDTALVTMRLDKGAAPIGAGALARSRPVNLLGEKYVDMDAGDLRRPQPSGTVIPMSRTSRPVELDDLLNILDPDTRGRLRILINEAGISMAGRGADFNAMLDALPPSLDQARRLVGDFSRDTDRLKALIGQSDRVIGAMNSKREGLQHLVDSADGTLKVAAEKRVQLAGTLEQAPGALRQLRATLGQLGTTSQRLEPAARDLRAASGPLATTLDQLPSFAKEAGPTMSALRSTAPTLTRLGAQARPTVRRLRPTLDRLDEFSQRLAPVVQTLDDGAMKNLLGIVSGWTDTTSRSDGLGHVFRLRILIDKELVTTAIQRYMRQQSPVRHRHRRRQAATAPSLDAAAPQAAAPPAPPAEAKRDGLLPKLPDVKLPPLPDVKSTVDTVTKQVPPVGGAQDQGRDGDAGKLFDYLFGP